MTRRHGEVYFNYSVAHLLEDVKGVFEDTFSEDVYNRLSTKRKENDFSKNLLYQDRDPDAAYSNRTLLMNALKTTAQTPRERALLGHTNKMNIS